MKVVLHQWRDSDGNNRDAMLVDGQEEEYCGPLYECPEDAIIGRDLISCADIFRWMKKAAELGKEIEFETVQGEPS